MITTMLAVTVRWSWMKVMMNKESLLPSPRREYLSFSGDYSGGGLVRTPYEVDH